MRAAPGATRGLSLPRRARRCPTLGSPLPEPAAMGAAESFPATPPSKPFLRHLAHVSDPRSPTPGILRTPIEVESSPQRSSSGGETATDQSQSKEAETASDQRQSWDPRSPTLGISRTPLKAAVADTINCLVKQLDEAFGTETIDQESLLEELLDQRPNLGAAPIPGQETNGKNPQREGSDRDASEEKIPMWREEKAKQQLSSACAQPVMRSSCFIDPPRTSGGKPTRRKASNKVLVVSGGTGRSPLSILQDDNSPSTLSSRQGKRHPSLAENLGEWKEVAADPACSLKSGGCVWNDLNKENQHCRLVEN